MTPKEISALVVATAKDGAPIERCALTVYRIALWVAIVCSILPIPAAFVSPEYVTVTALGFSIVPALLAGVIWEWLKRRLL